MGRKYHQYAGRPTSSVAPICPYCNKFSVPATGEEVYPHRADLFHKLFFVCRPCGARVGRHKDGKALGTLANEATREARMRAHQAFDPLWKDGNLSRSAAYAWLAKALGVSPKDCHIGQMDVATADKVSALSLKRRGKKLSSPPVLIPSVDGPVPEPCCPEVPPWELCEHQINGTAEVLSCTATADTT